MADATFYGTGNLAYARKMKDMGDGTYAEVVYNAGGSGSLFPKIAMIGHPKDYYTNVPPGAGGGYMERLVWPYTGTIIALAVYIITSAGNIDLGVYDTSATTRNRLVSTGSQTAAASGTWHTQTVSLAVKQGDSVDLAVSTSSASCTLACSAGPNNSYLLPTGWMPVPLGGAPRLNAYIASFFPLPTTLPESSMVIDANFPLLAARYA